MSMRTPLGRVRGLGSAKSGTDHFWRIRLTAVANVPLLLFFVGFLVLHKGDSYDQLRISLANPFVASLMGLMLVSGLYHMKLGMEEIIADYIHHEGGKVLALMLNTFFVGITGALCLYALLTVGLAGY